MRRPQGRAGLTVLEVTIAFSIVCTVLMASAGAFSSSYMAVRNAQSRSRGTVFAETVMEDLAAQPYDSLLAFSGNRMYDGPTVARSNYSVDLTVFLTAVDLLQVQAVLKDVRTNREIGRLTTLRTRR
jgi:Tfp pilus assembly protein PilV